MVEAIKDNSGEVAARVPLRFPARVFEGREFDYREIGGARRLEEMQFAAGPPFNRLRYWVWPDQANPFQIDDTEITGGGRPVAKVEVTPSPGLVRMWGNGKVKPGWRLRIWGEGNRLRASSQLGKTTGFPVLWQLVAKESDIHLQRLSGDQALDLDCPRGVGLIPIHGGRSGQGGVLVAPLELIVPGRRYAPFQVILPAYLANML